MQVVSSTWSDAVVSSKYAMVQLDPSGVDDLSLVSRIMASYTRTFKDRPQEGLWYDLAEQKFSPIDNVLRSQDIEAAAAVLRDPASSNLFWGFDNLIADFQESLQKPETQEGTRAHISLSMLRFAEMLGIVRIFNPEQLSKNVPPQIAPDQVLDAVGKLLDARIETPNIYPGEGGVVTSRGIFSYRAVQALYLIARIHTILGTIKGMRVLEIGAGLGRTANFGIKVGAKQYDIVDIPLTAVSQGYFLGRTLGDNAVRLQGESADDFSEAQVRLLTTKEFLDSNDQYDIIVNVDSLTEIPEEFSMRYVEKIVRATGTFLSINHEVNSATVRELFEHAHGITPLRHPCWTRTGYVEEIYLSQNATLSSSSAPARLRKQKTKISTMARIKKVLSSQLKQFLHNIVNQVR